MYISHSEKIDIRDISRYEEVSTQQGETTTADDFTVDSSGVIIGADVAINGPTQYGKDEILGKSISVFYGEQDTKMQSFRNDLKQATLNGAFTTYGTRFRKNRQAFFCRMEIYAFANSNGKTMGYRLKVSEFQAASSGNRKEVLAEHSPIKLPIPTRNGFLFVDFKDIIRCQSNLNYTNFILLDGTRIIASKNMGSFEEILNRANFIRIHKSEIINVAYIKAFTRADGGMVTMIDNSELALSRTYKASFFSRLCLNAVEK